MYYTVVQHNCANMYRPLPAQLSYGKCWIDKDLKQTQTKNERHQNYWRKLRTVIPQTVTILQMMDDPWSQMAVMNLSVCDWFPVFCLVEKSDKEGNDV